MNSEYVVHCCCASKQHDQHEVGCKRASALFSFFALGRFVLIELQNNMLMKGQVDECMASIMFTCNRPCTEMCSAHSGSICF